MCSRRILRNIEKPPAQGRVFSSRGYIRPHATTPRADRRDGRTGMTLANWFRSPGRSGCGSFVPRHALVSQKALVASAVYHGAAFLTGHVISGCFDHGDFVFRSAVACMRSGEPLYEFGHVRNMRSESIGCQPVGLPQIKLIHYPVIAAQCAMLGTMFKAIWSRLFDAALAA
jgi:hypothetical protein